jgi:uncharacterized protein YdcH (DUF465 family)
MSHVPNELHDEFPDAHERMRTLKQSDAHFARLVDSYHEINRAIHRANAEVEPTSDGIIEQMKKQRLAIKDELAAMIAN